jgi:hypothetical protein
LGVRAPASGISIAQLGGDAAGGGAAGGGRGPRGPSRRALNGVDLSGHLRLTTTESHDFRRVPCTRFGLPRRRTSPTLLTEAAASGSRRREGMCPALALRPDRHDVAGHRRRRVEERGAMWLPSCRCLTLQPQMHDHLSIPTLRLGFAAKRRPIRQQASAASRSHHHVDTPPQPCRPTCAPARFQRPHAGSWSALPPGGTCCGAMCRQSAAPMRRSVMRSDMLESGLPRHAPGNTN